MPTGMMSMWGSTMPMGTFGTNMGSAVYQGNYGMSIDQVRNKGKTRDADFEAAFAQVADSLPSARAESIENSDMADVENALREVTLETNKEGEVANQGVDFQR
jgi:peroxin-5